MEEETRSEKVMMRFTPSEIKEFEEERKRLGMNMSEYLRMRIYFTKYRGIINEWEKKLSS